jgi:hypothetical protein
MINLTKFEFVVLDISGKNYLPWTLDSEIHLTANNRGDTRKKLKIRPPHRRKPKK